MDFENNTLLLEEIDKGNIRKIGEHGLSNTMYECLICPCLISGLPQAVEHVHGNQHNKVKNPNMLFHKMDPDTLQSIELKLNVPRKSLLDRYQDGTQVNYISEYFCSLCNISLSGKAPMKQHLSGKSHHKKAKAVIRGSPLQSTFQGNRTPQYHESTPSTLATSFLNNNDSAVSTRKKISRDYEVEPKREDPNSYRRVKSEKKFPQGKPRKPTAFSRANASHIPDRDEEPLQQDYINPIINQPLRQELIVAKDESKTDENSEPFSQDFVHGREPGSINLSQNPEEQIDPRDQIEVNLYVSESSNVGASSQNITDPALWSEITDDFIDDIIHQLSQDEIVPNDEPCLAGKPKTLDTSEVSGSMFFRVMRNGEMIRRKWLIHSPTNGLLYCIYCKLFCKTSLAFINGFCDWKHVSTRISFHENSFHHKNSQQLLISRITSGSAVDLDSTRKDEEGNYWKKVLQRIIYVIGFLTERGVSLGMDINNDPIMSPFEENYIGVLELLSRFDPFLKELLSAYREDQESSPYLSTVTCEELVEYLADEVRRCIVREIREAKYFSVCLDSMSDFVQDDCIAIVVRYVKSSGVVVERVLSIVIPHSQTSLASVVFGELDGLGVDIENCRGLSYDDESNISTSYKELQAQVESVNTLCIFVPPAAESLNHNAKHIFDSCTAALNYFSLVQCIYTFLSLSARRWKAFTSIIEPNDRITLTYLKDLGNVRWAVDACAIKSLTNNYKSLLALLIEVSSDDEFCSPESRQEASILVTKLKCIEMAIMALLWNYILTSFNEVSLYLQSPDMKLQTVVDLFQSLLSLISKLRETESYAIFEAQARDLAEENNPGYKTELGNHQTITSQGGETFCAKTYDVTLCKLHQLLLKRMAEYTTLADTFGFLNVIYSLDDDAIQNKSVQLLESYEKDVEHWLVNECIQLKSLGEIRDLSIIEKLQWLKHHRLNDIFPNLIIALRLYLTLCVSGAPKEISLQEKRTKLLLRSCQTEGKLGPFFVLALNQDLVSSIQEDPEVIEKFSKMKAGSVNL